MADLFFEVTQEPDGGYGAECLTESIFTQADSWEELRASLLDAVEALYRGGFPWRCRHVHSETP